MNKLRIIEGLCYIWENGPKTVEQADKLFSSVYKVTHSKKSCLHKDWEEYTQELGKNLERMGIL